MLAKAMLKLSMIDSRRWIAFLLDLLPRLETVELDALAPLQKCLFQMFYVTVRGRTVSDWRGAEVKNDLRSLVRCPVLLDELAELLKYRFDHIDFVDSPLDLGFDCPLDLHCTYSRDQLLAALDVVKPQSVREGVKWLPDKKLDVLFVTLNKSDKDYSPTTMYDDYSIDEHLFHWQSQSGTGESSATGQRYIHHKERGSRVLLFVREFRESRFAKVAEAYTCLGTACYVQHEGEKPMNIIWHLDAPIPAKFLRTTNKLAVG